GLLPYYATTPYYTQIREKTAQNPECPPYHTFIKREINGGSFHLKAIIIHFCSSLPVKQTLIIQNRRCK
ncbi:MAG TPA: hypothetical protein PKY46_12565, partial [Ignavibacteriaceae bacterium]|nr:hypothetical protein [Ignavibacteriaceae bacterium]